MPRGPKSGKGVTSRVILPKKGARSAYYIARLLELDPSTLTRQQKIEISELIRDSHRITPVSKSKAKSGRSIFNSVTGHHEWLPTDRAFQIVTSGGLWSKLYCTLRSPTWLLVLNPDRYCADRDAYAKAIQQAVNHARAGKGGTTDASSLGLVGHSGGLCRRGTQLTQHQSTWHDGLRDIYERNAPTNNVLSYWNELQSFIQSHFLFVHSPQLPTGAVDMTNVTQEALLRAIRWDLDLSVRGNPGDAGPMDTLYDVAQYLHGQWSSTWWRYLENSFKAAQTELH